MSDPTSVPPLRKWISNTFGTRERPIINDLGEAPREQTSNIQSLTMPPDVVAWISNMFGKVKEVPVIRLAEDTVPVDAEYVP